MQIQIFEPFSILGLESGASDSEIKKAYRRLSIQYHPDKNPDPGWGSSSSVNMCSLALLWFSKYCVFFWIISVYYQFLFAFIYLSFLFCFPEAHKYFVEFISKAYQALTDPISRENYEKYGHPDGRQVMNFPMIRKDLLWYSPKNKETIYKKSCFWNWMYYLLMQGFQMGIALPQFLLNFDGATGGILLLWIVGVCILLPLVIAVVYLSRSAKYTGNYVMHQTLSTYYYFMKPSLAPRYYVYLIFFLIHNLFLKNISTQVESWKVLFGYSLKLWMVVPSGCS